MTESLQLLAVAALGALSFAILFRTPRRYLHHTVAIGCLACLSLNIAKEHHGLAIATFLTTLAIGILSLILARLTGKPAQGFLVPSVIFLVPGTRIYQAFDSALREEYAAASETLIGAVLITVAISFALLLANWLIPTRKSL